MKDLSKGIFTGIGIALGIVFVCVSCLVAVALMSDPTITGTNPTVDANAVQTLVMERALQTLTAQPKPAFEWTATETPTLVPTPTLVSTNIPTMTAIVLPTQPVIAPPVQPDHPSGTSGRCNDGTYTYANNSQGACSHHGGIAEWWGK